MLFQVSIQIFMELSAAAVMNFVTAVEKAMISTFRVKALTSDQTETNGFPGGLRLPSSIQIPQPAR